MSGTGPDANLVLTGMMGVGKGTVGRALSQLLGRPFVDTDDVVERLAGRSVEAVFAGGGEAAFRRLEGRALRSLAGLRRAVVSTGGGTVLSPANRRLLRRLGCVIWLTAAPEAMALRTGAGTPAAETRPLLAGLDRQAAVRRLLDLARERAPLYAGLARHRVDTTHVAANQAAREICLRAGLDRRPHEAPGSPLDGPPASGAAAALRTAARHPVYCGSGIISGPGCLEEALADYGGRAVLVTDPLVGALYGDRVLEAAARAGLDAVAAYVPRGEAAKCPAVLVSLYRKMLAARLGRDGAVIALGGGSVGDVAGLAAATFSRGIRHVQMPTTLLAQVDSALGGKTAIDLDGVKNPVGAFHQPSAVVADVSVLSTLAPAELRSGLAEVLKYGLCFDEELWGRAVSLSAPADGCALPYAAPRAAYFLVSRCLSLKAAAVAEDERETGPRAALNFGHTLGHALEGAGQGRLRHGEAVALGMDFAASLGERSGMTSRGTAAAVREALGAAGLLPAAVRLWGRARGGLAAQGAGAGELMRLMSQDKKAVRGRPRFIFLRAIGQVEPGPVEVPAQDLKAALEDWLRDMARTQPGSKGGIQNGQQ